MPALRTTWHGALARVASLAILTLALCIALAASAHAISAASKSIASCGSSQSACGPQVCQNITPADYALPGTAPVGGARALLSRQGGFNSSPVSLSGSNWPAGAAVEVLLGLNEGNTIWVDSTPYGQGTASASGDLSIASISPPPVEGCMDATLTHYEPDQVLFIVQTPTQSARISLLYTFYPSPQFASTMQNTVSAGAQVLLTGQGWDPSQTVTITPMIQSWPSKGYPSSEPAAFTSLTGLASTFRPQSDGSFSVLFRTPVEPPETQITYSASASYALYGAFTVPLSEVFSVLPSTTPTLTLSRASGLAGSSVALTGTDWPANQDITITYCRGHQFPYCDPTVSQNLVVGRTDSAGHLKATVQVPADAQPGPITIQAYPVASPFIFLTYARALPFSILYPFDQAHPRLALAIHAAPFVAGGLILVLLLLAGWLYHRRCAAREREAPGGV